LWQLPLHKLPLKSKQHRVSVFACALLQGKVFPAMVNLSPNLAADPATLLLPANRAQKRVSKLLHCMEAASVDSRSKLKVMWDVQPDFLFEEVLLWVQKKSHLQLKKIWETLQSEAQLSAKELFPKKKRK
jgi:ATP-dependent RNA helicase DHX37/DHR1